MKITIETESGTSAVDDKKKGNTVWEALELFAMAMNGAGYAVDPDNIQYERKTRI